MPSNSFRYIGVNDHDIDLFEGQYEVPSGMSYNSWVLLDGKVCVLDTVDRAFADEYIRNLEAALEGRDPDYLVVSHVEPDHASSVQAFLDRWPRVTLVGNAKTFQLLANYFVLDNTEKLTVKEGDTLPLGAHTLHFVTAPMVHWPEVMMSYEESEKVLFSADAFGQFGALDMMPEWDDDEARRYYLNIVGKYGAQVQAALKKVAALDPAYVCPLHGPVWRSGFGGFVEKYRLWSSYAPEEKSVLLAYASVYGHTENAANILACRLAERGVRVRMYDTSVTPASYIVSDAFRCSHLVFAATTYNAGVFVTMENLLHDIAAHNLQGRRVALIENGSWAPTSGKVMRELLAPLKNMEFIADNLSLKSALAPGQEAQLEALADAIAAEILPAQA